MRVLDLRSCYVWIRRMQTDNGGKPRHTNLVSLLPGTGCRTRLAVWPQRPQATHKPLVRPSQPTHRHTCDTGPQTHANPSYKTHEPRRHHVTLADPERKAPLPTALGPLQLIPHMASGRLRAHVLTRRASRLPSAPSRPAGCSRAPSSRPRSARRPPGRAC